MAFVTRRGQCSLLLSIATALALLMTTSDAQGGSTSTAGSSAQAPECSYSLYRADLNGTKTISRNSTTPAPIQTPANGTYFLCLDKGGQARNEWVLQLCDIKNYAASHLHTGSSKTDYPPPLVPLEPYVRPLNPTGPTAQLPFIDPFLNVTGCTNRNGSFAPGDVIALAGNETIGAPPVRIFSELVTQLDKGNIYINAHTVQHLPGEIRGNLYSIT